MGTRASRFCLGGAKLWVPGGPLRPVQLPTSGGAGAGAGAGASGSSRAKSDSTAAVISLSVISSLIRTLVGISPGAAAPGAAAPSSSTSSPAADSASALDSTSCCSSSFSCAVVEASGLPGNTQRSPWRTSAHRPVKDKTNRSDPSTASWRRTTSTPPTTASTTPRTAPARSGRGAGVSAAQTTRLPARPPQACRAMRMARSSGDREWNTRRKRTPTFPSGTGWIRVGNSSTSFSTAMRSASWRSRALMVAWRPPGVDLYWVAVQQLRKRTITPSRW
mmetsp:Transcript_116153/g.266620  ORF Transcript_116153/g.266620 Transcript_116153/m.266620 type:complete len:277 (+) Transcript_116153:299-1129(+)